MIDDIIGGLKSLSVSKMDKSELKDALEHTGRVQRRTIVAGKDIQRNIDDTMEAIDSFLSITSADTSEIRVMMDVLLEVYLGKLILLFSS